MSFTGWDDSTGVSDKPILIRHEPEQQRFVALVEGHQSLANYRLSGRLVDFNHTYVPDALRGRGIAEKLVVAALQWARAENYTIEASCGYVVRFLKKAN